MIQRIQSIYLFLVAIGAFILLMAPLTHYSLVSDITVYVNMLKGSHNPVEFIGLVKTWPMLVFNGIMAVLALVSIFMYKNRMIQLKIAMFGFLSNIILVGMMFFMLDGFQKTLNAVAVHYDYGIFIPVVTLIMFVLATKAIRKDEAKVRAADRLR
jgi:hypothetical protein